MRLSNYIHLLYGEDGNRTLNFFVLGLQPLPQDQGATLMEIIMLICVEILNYNKVSTKYIFKNARPSIESKSPLVGRKTKKLGYNEENGTTKKTQTKRKWC